MQSRSNHTEFATASVGNFNQLRLQLLAGALLYGLLYYAGITWLLAFKPFVVNFAVIASLLLITSFLCVMAVRSFLRERGDLSPADEVLGQEIRVNANPSQVVFVARRSKVDVIKPNLTYFASRNIQMVAGEDEATAFLKKYGRSEGVLFRADLEGRLLGAPIPLNLK